MIISSSFQYSYLWLPLIGFVVGLLATMIGGGGGFFFPPALILFFQTPAHVAVATSLAATLPICFTGAIGHYRNGNIDLRIGMVFGIAGIMGAFAGASVTGLMSPDQLKTGFGIYSLLLGLLLIFNSRFRSVNNTPVSKRNIFSVAFSKIPKGSFYGFAGGMISGTFGTSGTAPVLAGLFAIKMPIKLVAGTSLMILFLNTLAALTGHLVMGEIDFTLVWLLTSGAVLGSIAGPRVTKGWDIGKREGAIKHSFAIIVIVFGLIMIFF